MPSPEQVNGRPLVFVGWDCAGSTGAGWVVVVDPLDVARAAWGDLQRNGFPDQPIVLSIEAPISNTWTALSLDMPWEAVSATASDGPVTATVTATPVRVEWDTGPINPNLGRPDLRYVTCPDAGDQPYWPEQASCKAWFMSSSATEVDATGTLHRISIAASVVWRVSFTTTVGVSNDSWLTHRTDSRRDGVPVAEVQSVVIK